MRAVLLGALTIVVAGCAGATPAAVAPASTPAAAAAATPAPATATSVTQPAADPVAQALPAFSCSPVSGGASTRAGITAVRVGSNPGFDRFVIQFDGPVPGYAVAPQATSSFVADASGQSVHLAGAAGVAIRLSPSSGQGTYSGPNAFTPAYAALREARQVGDFEAVVHWGLGTAGPTCIRAFTLTSPARLVVDVSHT